jgi:hypothetical protein
MVDQLRQDPAHGCWSAEEVHFGVEEFLTGQGDADVANVAACAGGPDRLRHRFLGADGFDNRVSTESAREFPDDRDAFVAAFGHDVGSAEFQG